METVQVGQVGLNLADKASKTLTPDANASAYPSFYDAVSKYGGNWQEPVPFETWVKNPAAYNVAPTQSVYGGSWTIDGGSLNNYTQDIMGHAYSQTRPLTGWTYDPGFKGAPVPYKMGYNYNVAPVGLMGTESFTQPTPQPTNPYSGMLGGFGTNMSPFANMMTTPKYTQDQLNRQQYSQYTGALDQNNQLARSNALANWLKSANPQIGIVDFRSYWNDRDGQKGVMNRMPVADGQNMANLWLSGASKADWATEHPGLQVSAAKQGAGVSTGFSGGGLTQGIQEGPMGNDSLGNTFGGQKLDGAAPNLGEWAGGGFSGSSAFSGTGDNAVDGAGAMFGRGSGKKQAGLSPMEGPGYAAGGMIGQPPGGGMGMPPGGGAGMGMPQQPPGGGLGMPQQPQEANPQQSAGMVNYAVSDMLQRNPQATSPA